MFNGNVAFYDVCKKTGIAVFYWCLTKIKKLKAKLYNFWQVLLFKVVK